jgi:hypothetical protein
MNHFYAAAENVRSRDTLQKRSTNNFTIVSYQLKVEWKDVTAGMDSQITVLESCRFLDGMRSVQTKKPPVAAFLSYPRC